MLCFLGQPIIERTNLIWRSFFRIRRVHPYIPYKYSMNILLILHIPQPALCIQKRETRFLLAINWNKFLINARKKENTYKTLSSVTTFNFLILQLWTFLQFLFPLIPPLIYPPLHINISIWPKNFKHMFVRNLWFLLHFKLFVSFSSFSECLLKFWKKFPNNFSWFSRYFVQNSK